MLQGIHHIHANGFSHRDLKPENVLIDVTNLNDDTIVGDQTWNQLKQAAMQPDYETTPAFTAFQGAEKKLVLKLIDAQRSQGDLNVLKPIPTKFSIKIVDFGFAAPLEGDN